MALSNGTFVEVDLGSSSNANSKFDTANANSHIDKSPSLSVEYDAHDPISQPVLVLPDLKPIPIKPAFEPAESMEVESIAIEPAFEPAVSMEVDGSIPADLAVPDLGGMDQLALHMEQALTNLKLAPVESLVVGCKNADKHLQWYNCKDCGFVNKGYGAEAFWTRYRGEQPESSSSSSSDDDQANNTSLFYSFDQEDEASLPTHNNATTAPVAPLLNDTAAAAAGAFNNEATAPATPLVDNTAAAAAGLSNNGATASVISVFESW